MKVAKVATRPTATLEDDIEIAPLVDALPEVSGAALAEEEELTTGAAGVLLVAGAALARAALRS